MNDVLSPEIVVDNNIRSQPELMREVEKASDFLLAQVRNGPPLSSPAEVSISWKQPCHDGAVWVTLTEIDDAGERTTTYQIKPSYMKDVVSREVSMLRMWQKVLKFRSDENMKRIDHLINRLESEESNG